jgi:hypothetical protein
MLRAACTPLLLLALSGCAQVHAWKAEGDVRRAAEDDATCKSYGLAFGTTAYAECRENAATQRNAADIAMMQHLNQEPVKTKCTSDGNNTNCESQ